MFEIMSLNHVRMGSNDYIHAKRHQVLVYMKLVGEEAHIALCTVVHEDYYDIDFSLKKNIMEV